MVTALREKCLANKFMKGAGGTTWESPTDDPVIDNRRTIIGNTSLMIM